MGEYSSLSGNDHFLDIACGTGLFALALGREGATGHGVDINRHSIEMARQNAKTNGIENITFKAQPSSEIHPTRYKPAVVIADPPRAGLDRRSRRTIGAMAPERIVYVSCNPATFGRDCRDFIKEGYELTTLTMIDMFPGTHHLEVIGKLERK